MFRTSPRIINIIPLDVKEKLKKGEKVNIIDVRENEEVAQGKIPGAKHIRLSEIPSRLHEIDPNVETIMVCRSGNRSAKACEFLMNQGYRNVKNMMGGMNAWEGDVE
ncbi:rhodanese-like domain-containing protein [Effusibacillus dendaii]|uniref:Rhodanese-like domain-containing protein n=1 Tax=Effusibacillus dendaii TaxID=2743772 RepID=A0A7I8DDK6_9BACL|nr:rhodanese-like domain-containing protein [Effusibacillus dendaii]BCJ88278.1 rhodanese-like domain-containing protein [Effusibacillus dendaii]